MTTERKYRVIVEFTPGKGAGLDPVFTFWVNEDQRLHYRFITKMLEAAAQERWKVPIVSDKYTGEDFLSIVKDYAIIRIS